MYSWIIFFHVIGMFGFLIAHGVSASVFFALERERSVNHIRLLLNLSAGSSKVLVGSLLLLLLSGVAGSFIGHWWGKGWIWLSIFLFFGIYAVMALLGTRVLNEIRICVGLPSAYGQAPFPEPYSEEKLVSVLNRIHPVRLASLGFGGLAVIAWLMIFKPF